MVGLGSSPIPGGGGLKFVPGPPNTILGAGVVICDGVAEDDPATSFQTDNDTMSQILGSMRHIYQYSLTMTEFDVNF